MKQLTAIDLFAGAGGATQGLQDAGFEVVGAVEIDPVAAESYRLNHPEVELWEQDIRLLTASKMRVALGLESGELTLLKACPPCQGFSTLADGSKSAEDDPRNDLVGHTIRFVRALRPESVLVENVPGLGRDRRSGELLRSLESLGYSAKSYVVNAIDFGVPQRRKRFIILAFRGTKHIMPTKLSFDDLETPVTVRAAFAELEATISPSDPLHVARKSSDLVQRRIAAVPVGGSRFDLPLDLQLDCHKNLVGSKRSAAGSYGRLKWEEPAPTMTTRCTTPACGSFIHPDLDRGITLREAAAIQTFPVNYKFSGSHGAIERQIGNAVPVKMATGIARTVLATIGRES